MATEETVDLYRVLINYNPTKSYSYNINIYAHDFSYNEVCVLLGKWDNEKYEWPPFKTPEYETLIPWTKVVTVEHLGEVKIEKLNDFV